MGVVDEIATRLARHSVDWSPAALTAEANRMLDLEAPLLAEDRAALVVDRIVGLGPIQPLLAEADITDVLVNGPDEVWVDRGARLERVDVRFESAADLMATVERAIAGLGLRIDRSSPMIDGRLADGSRIHAAIPPAAVDHPVVAIRRFAPAVRNLGQLVAAGSIREGQAGFLRERVRARDNIIVSGPTGSGKTTLLNVLSAEIPGEERIVTVEDAAELALEGHVVRLEARPPNSEGFGEVRIRDLLRSALRLRPDRILLGEVRGAEALDLITALNTGHPGSMSTVHANSPEEAMWRLETLALLDGSASPDAVRRQLQVAIGVVVQLARTPAGRTVGPIATVDRDGKVSEIDV